MRLNKLETAPSRQEKNERRKVFRVHCDQTIASIDIASLYYANSSRNYMNKKDHIFLSAVFVLGVGVTL